MSRTEKSSLANCRNSHYHVRMDSHPTWRLASPVSPIMVARQDERGHHERAECDIDFAILLLQARNRSGRPRPPRNQAPDGGSPQLRSRAASNRVRVEATVARTPRGRAWKSLSCAMIMSRQEGQAPPAVPQPCHLVHQRISFLDEPLESGFGRDLAAHHACDDLALRAPDPNRVAAWIALPWHRPVGLAAPRCEIAGSLGRTVREIAARPRACWSEDIRSPPRRSSGPPGRSGTSRIPRPLSVWPASFAVTMAALPPVGMPPFALLSIGKLPSRA